MANEFIARNGIISRGNLLVTGSLTTSGSLTATGTITATTLVVQTVTSSISSITGSTNFGSLSSNTHMFTGSINASGSGNFSGSLTASSTFTLDGTKKIFLRSNQGTGGGLISGSAIGAMGNFSIYSDDGVAGDILGMYYWNGGTYRSALQFANVSSGNSNLILMKDGGSIGIGTTSPQSLLDVRGATPFIRITDTSVTGENGLIMDAGGGFIRGALTINYGTGEFKISAGSAGNSYYQTFLVNGTERMRVTNGGDVYIGTTSESGARFASISDAGNKIAFQGRVPNGAAVPIIQASSVTVGSTSWYAFVAQSGNGSTVTANTMFIYGNGNVVNLNNSYGALSDIKLKENIVDATPKLADLMQLRVRNYNLIADESKTKQIGFIAQEFEEVFPGLVEESPDKDMDGNGLGTATKSIKISVLVPMLVKAIQELTARVIELENK